MTTAPAQERPLPAIEDPLIMVVINQAWREDDDDVAVYEATRGHWRIGEGSRSRAKLVLGIAGGIVRGAYRPHSWFESPHPGDEGRWGFVGEPATDLNLVGTSVKRLAPPRGAANPVRLFLDGISAAEEVDIAALADQLHAEPLARIMFGQRELFHSNLLAWFFDQLPDLADQVFYSLSEPGDAQERSVERESRNLDLVLRWPGRAPLVIENKVFSLPDLEQLDGYATKTASWAGSRPSHCLLSIIEPPLEMRDTTEGKVAFTPNGWRYLSYDALADRLDEVLQSADATYETDTMRHYSTMVRLLSALIASTSIRANHTDERVWLLNDDLARIDSGQLRMSLHKMRAHRMATLIENSLPNGSGPVEANLTHGKPLVGWYHWISREGEEVGVGWQFQDGQFRRHIITPHLHGSSAEHKAQRAAFASRNLDLVDFRDLSEIFSVPDARIGPLKTASGFGDFSPTYVYRYLPVGNPTVSQLLKAAAWVQNDVAD